MTKSIKFTNDEIKQINDLRLEVSGVFTQLGQISIEKKKKLFELSELEKKEEPLAAQHNKLVVVEQELFKSLNKKYGDGNYNPENGVFTPLNTNNQENQTETKQ